MYVNRKTNRGTRLTINKNVGEDRRTRDIETGGDKEPARDGNGFNRLVNRSSANTLHINGNAVFYHTGNGAGN